MAKRLIAFGVASFLALALHSEAQMGTGRVTGTVKDTQGKPIAGAQISASSPESDRALETTSDEDGKWALLGFRSGTYEFSFTASGFQPAAYKNAVKQMGRNPSMDVILEPLAMGQSSGGGGAGGMLDAANALFEQGQFAEAIVKYEEILTAEPTLYQMHYNIGSAYRELKEFDKAVAEYQKVLAQEPSNVSALVSIGDVMILQGKLDDAVTYFEKAIGQTQDEVIPFNVAEIYFNQGNAEKALTYYQTAAERKPDWPEPYLKMGYAHLNTGNMDGAVTAFEKVVEVAPDSPQAQMAQAALSTLKK